MSRETTDVGSLCYVKFAQPWIIWFVQERSLRVQSVEIPFKDSSDQSSVEKRINRAGLGNHAQWWRKRVNFSASNENRRLVICVNRVRMRISRCQEKIPLGGVRTSTFGPRRSITGMLQPVYPVQITAGSRKGEKVLIEPPKWSPRVPTVHIGAWCKFLQFSAPVSSGVS